MHAFVLHQVVAAIQGAADALTGEEPPAAKSETPVLPEPEPKADKVERSGVEGGAYRVDVNEVLGGRMI